MIRWFIIFMLLIVIGMMSQLELEFYTGEDILYVHPFKLRIDRESTSSLQYTKWSDFKNGLEDHSVAGARLQDWEVQQLLRSYTHVITSSTGEVEVFLYNPESDNGFSDIMNTVDIEDGKRLFYITD